MIEFFVILVLLAGVAALPLWVVLNGVAGLPIALFGFVAGVAALPFCDSWPVWLHCSFCSAGRCGCIALWASTS